MHHNLASIEPKVLQEYFTKASLLLASQRFSQAEEAMIELAEKIKTASNNYKSIEEQELLSKSLSECYVNLAICLLNKDNGDENVTKITELLETAVSLDNQNIWAYFNLASQLYRASNYKGAYNNINCSLSCLYLLKAVLSKDGQNRNRQLDLGKSIGLCENNLEARMVRLLLQLKQSKWKMAYNQVELALEIFADSSQLKLLKDLLQPFLNNKNITINEHKDIFKQSAQILSSMQKKKKRLMASPKNYNQISILKDIDQKISEFNQLLKQVNELGNIMGVFNYKTVYRTSKMEKKTHIVSNLIHQANQKKKVETMPNSQNIELEAKVIERMNQSKKSLTQSKLNESKNSDSLFQLTKSQNLQTQNHMESSNKVINGNLLSSLQLTVHKPLKAASGIDQSFGNQFNFQGIEVGNMRKKMQIQVIQSEIQPLEEHQEQLRDSNVCSPHQHFVNEDQDLLLQSIYDQEYQSPQVDMNKKGEVKLQQQKQQKTISKNQQIPLTLYPSTDQNRVIELVLIQSQFREDFKQKLIGIYCQLEYNSGLIDTYKFRSRQVNQNNTGSLRLQWGQSLGFIKLAEEPKNMLVKLFKSQPYLYDDRFLGQGEIQVTTIGIIRIPLYLKVRNVGTVSIKLALSQQNLSNSFKQSISNSGISSSIRSQSQTSLPS